MSVDHDPGGRDPTGEDRSGGNAQPSEEDYWAQIKAYNADGSYAYPPSPINADQVYDFWMHVPVPDAELHRVRERDQARHLAMEEKLSRLHCSKRYISVRRPPIFLRRGVELLPLSPQVLQAALDKLAQKRTYRRHPELLTETDLMADLQLAIQRTNELRSSVPPHRIPDEQMRLAARLGSLMHNSGGLQQSELDALWTSYDVVFMGERQSIRRVYDVWRPDLIV